MTVFAPKSSTSVEVLLTSDEYLHFLAHRAESEKSVRGIRLFFYIAPPCLLVSLLFFFNASKNTWIVLSVLLICVMWIMVVAKSLWSYIIYQTICKAQKDTPVVQAVYPVIYTIQDNGLLVTEKTAERKKRHLVPYGEFTCFSSYPDMFIFQRGDEALIVPLHAFSNKDAARAFHKELYDKVTHARLS